MSCCPPRPAAWPRRWRRPASSRCPSMCQSFSRRGAARSAAPPRSDRDGQGMREGQGMTANTGLTAGARTAQELRAQAYLHGAHNYHPLPVVICDAEGAWVTDVEGRRYLDMLAAYSATNFGHRHPRLVAAAQRQLERVTLVSRAFEHDQFGPFCAELAALAGREMVLPMNTGAEAVETAIKTARKWGYEVKGVPDGEAVIIVFDGNFHGRTTTIISFSPAPAARDSFGPYTPGFRIVPYGDLEALAAAMDENVVGVLVEPIQGEAGVLVPPARFLTGVREICTAP